MKRMTDKADRAGGCCDLGPQPMNRSGPRRESWWRRLWRVIVQIVIRTPQLDRTNATELDRVMMCRAIDVARAGADLEEVPVGAVIYRNDTGEILAEDHNRRETDADPTAHAEMLVMRQAAAKLGAWRLVGCTLVVTLEPCTMCAGAIVNSRIDRIVYGATDPKAGAVESLYQICEDRRLNHRPEVVRGVMAPECRGLLRDFFKQRRRENRLNRQAM
jgi:tRNA(adenine34) deaminase